ncbi:MAG: oligosaccharide flippase family protein [Nanoarchaeota archaeon]
MDTFKDQNLNIISNPLIGRPVLSYDIIIKYLSKQLNKGNREKAKAFAFYFGKIMAILFGISAIILLFSAKFIAENYYQKPLFLALIAGIIYIFFLRISSFFISILQAKNYFKGVFQKELILQVFRIIIVPLITLFLLKKGASSEIILFAIILGISLVYIINIFFLFFTVKKQTQFQEIKNINLSKDDKKKANKFLFFLSMTVLSGIFFSYIDMIMLGKFVAAEFIGYYKVAFSLVSAVLPLIGFSTALLPIFSRLNSKKIKKAVKKTANLTILLSFPFILLVILAAPLIIKITYGEAYFPSINLLRIFSLILISAPLLSIYQVYYISIGKPKLLAKLLIFSTVLNILLNYIFIKSFLPLGDLATVFGVAIATLLSNYILLGLFIFYKKRKKINKETNKTNGTT